MVVDGLAQKGQRTLGVARTRGEDGPWQFMGILPLFDPPREDSAETIAQAQAHGIQVKMVTGDNQAIAREIAGKLGLGRNIRNADRLLSEGQSPDDDLAAPHRSGPTASPRFFPNTSSGSSRHCRTRGISSA